jgi:hypothetical protein
MMISFLLICIVILKFVNACLNVDSYKIFGTSVMIELSESVCNVENAHTISV